MDTKHIHCMLEDMANYGKEMISCAVGNGDVNLDFAGKVVDIVKDLAEAEYHARMAKCLRKEDEEDEAEEKYMMRMLKDEHKDEYKRMREEYGDSEETDRRFYDAWRYKSSGRFAPKGRGTRYGRRGYSEPPYYHVMPEEAEWYRDMDKETRGKMYYSETMPRNNSVRDYREGRSGQSRRNYMETKEINRGNTPEEKQKKMKELESYMKELSEDVTEMISDATPEEKSLLKQKMQVLMQKI